MKYEDIEPGHFYLIQNGPDDYHVLDFAYIYHKSDSKGVVYRGGPLGLTSVRPAAVIAKSTSIWHRALAFIYRHMP